MEPKISGIYEAVVASISPETSTVIGHFQMEGQPYGIEMTFDDFPEPPLVGQYFEMDFDQYNKDKYNK